MKDMALLSDLPTQASGVESPDDDRDEAAEKARANEVLSQLKLLSSDKVEQVYQRGKLLNEWSERRLYKRLRHGSKNDVLDRIGLRPSTASSDQQLAAKFDLDTVRLLGIGKARLLAANFFDDPTAVVYGGLDLPDGNGGVEHYNVEEVSYRVLQALIKRYRAAKRADAAVTKPQDEVQLEIEAAAKAILEDLEPSANPAQTSAQAPVPDPQDEPQLPNEPVAEPPLADIEPAAVAGEQTSEVTEEAPAVEELPTEEPVPVDAGPGGQAHKGRRRRRRHGRS